ncbi:unnamed protein product [Lupinus luteus]|uniref:AP2/ERF domain-containing protein n=1 Tax=Lupinus luteus TaxID=3873 RepID=A0AAV1XUT8_LUPLU
MVKPNNENTKERSCQFKGIRKRKWGKWVSEIRLPNSRQRIWLGSFDSAEKAARAFDAATFCLRGRNARFNFPDDPPDIAGGNSMTPTQIQAAAATFANSEPHVKNPGRPVKSESHVECSSVETILLQTESPSPCLSEGNVQTDSDVTVNDLFSDLLAPIGSGNFITDYGMFPGLDDFSGEYYIPEMDSVNYYGEENMDGFIVEDSFLWNF